MAIYFSNNDYFRSYNRDYVKNIHALKQQQNTGDMLRFYPDQILEEDSIVISCPGRLPENYYNALAKDYLDGNITDEEFYGHLEDIYLSLGGWADEVPPERKQAIYTKVLCEAQNGIMDYYLRKNKVEWENAGEGVTFYYNSDYHYMHLEAKERFIQGANALAEKLGRDSIEDEFRTYITTVNGRMAAMIGGNSGVFDSLDEVPPPGMKISISVKYNYWASVSYLGKTYTEDIPFDYGKYAYQFNLGDLFLKHDIPEILKGFVGNITVVHYPIARTDPNSFLNSRLFTLDWRIMDVISQYEKSSLYL